MPEKRQTSLLEVKGLGKRFGGVHAVDDFNAVVDRNRLVGIIGPNGAGKTTILNLLSGVYPCNSGEIIFQGQNIAGKRSYEIGRRGMTRTFQNIRLFADMSVLDNVKIAFSWQAKYGMLQAMIGLKGVAAKEKEVEEKALHWLDRVGLAKHGGEFAGSLPYGLQRRVELARALAGEPRLLLLDEPAAGLNPAEVRAFVELIQELFGELDLSIILIEHRMEVVMRLCHWIYVQDFGRTIGQGTPEQIRKDPVVIKAYLGEEFE
ncbi:MAG TPA: ABC transporter ATP-binding protein [Bacillota bacterium]|jgi:branched-chain amino acid transport system ATP-binding protein